MLLSDDTPCHYDSMKNPTDFTCSNGAGVTYSFDYTHHTNRLLSVQTLDLEQEVLASYGYVYDDIGNATTITDLSGPTTYAYDALYQLTNATRLNATGAELSTIGYGYDGFGNRTTVTQTGNNQTNTYDPGNELTHGGPTNVGYGYDQAGNMTSAGSVNYTWDALDRMTKISASPAGPITYVYDGDNLRVRKLSAGTTINYFYDGHSEVLETDGNGNVLKSFNPGIRMTDKQNNKLYYLFNGHGDVTGLMDGNEELVQSYNYDPYGTTVGTQKDPNNMRYVGSDGVYSDDDAGLQYMVNRWYNPTLGRFVNRDPKGLSGGLNLYCYVNNNPLFGSDPMGLCPLDSSNGINPIFMSIPNVSGLQNPLEINYSTSTAANPASQGVQVGADAALLGVNLSSGIFQGNYDGSSSGAAVGDTTFVPAVIGGDYYIHIGFDNSAMFSPFNGALNSIGVGYSKYLGIGLDANGISANFGFSWPPIPYSFGISTTTPYTSP